MSYTEFHQNRSSNMESESPRHFVLQPSARVSQTLGPSYLSHVIAAAM
jgi:hypothetical protein